MQYRTLTDSYCVYDFGSKTTDTQKRHITRKGTGLKDAKKLYYAYSLEVSSKICLPHRLLLLILKKFHFFSSTSIVDFKQYILGSVVKSLEMHSQF